MQLLHDEAPADRRQTQRRVRTDNSHDQRESCQLAASTDIKPVLTCRGLMALHDPTTGLTKDIKLYYEKESHNHIKKIGFMHTHLILYCKFQRDTENRLKML